MPAEPPMTLVEELTPEAFRPFGWVIGKPMDPGAASTFASAASDFWSEHVFETGGGRTELLSVVYRSTDLAVSRLECHPLTQQLLLPLDGDVLQFVALGEAEDVPPAAVRVFRVRRATGICMAAGVWHATRVATEPVRCLMLTRDTTTLDLAAHLIRGVPALESRFTEIRPPLRLDKLD